MKVEPVHTPQILISIGHHNNVTPYARAVSRAGGLPVIAYAGESTFVMPDCISGVILAGGASVEPARYNAIRDTTIKKSVDLERDALEWDVLDQATARSLPVLGICRGLQVLNVYFGGTLHQFLPNAGYTGDHRPDELRAYLAHTVHARDGHLAELLGTEAIHVNSIHRQGIDRLAPQMQATVFSPDGLIEGIENPDQRIVAVQWHPEELAEPGQPSFELFTDLVHRARLGMQASVVS